MTKPDGGSDDITTPDFSGERDPFQTAISENPLRAVLSIEPPEEMDCLAVSASEKGRVETHYLRKGTPADDGGGENACSDYCHVELQSDEDGHSSFLERENEGLCIKQILANTTCIPKSESVEHGTFVLTIIFPSRTELRKLISDLRSAGAQVNLDKLVFSNPTGLSDESLLDRLTEKQREAVEIAVARGYYETPRQGELEEIAEELDISVSAASERLNRAEARLIRSLLVF